MQYSQEHLKTMVYAEFGGQTECIMGNWKIENIIINFHLVFQFDRINSLSGNFYLSSLVDFSALWTNISAGVTAIYNKSFHFSSILSLGASWFWKREDPRDEFANFQTNGRYKSKDT